MLHRFATIQKFAVGGAELPPRTIIATISDETPDRVGDIMVASGLTNATEYNETNPVVLAWHEPTKVVGNGRVSVKSHPARVEAVIKFAPKGVSETADEIYGLVKAGALNGVSIGFQPIESEPLRGGGMKFTKWALLEISIVAVPANPSALILQRSYGGKVWASGISAADREHYGQVLKHLKAAGECHVAMLDAHDELASLSRALRDRLVEAKGHYRDAIEHLGRLGQRNPAPDDDEPNSELAARVARLKRLKECEDLRVAGDAPFVKCPEAFKVVDPQRQVVAIIAHVTPTSAGYSFLPLGADWQTYMAKSAAIFWEHDTKKPIAWCTRVDVFGDRIEATAQFPQVAVSALADEIFHQIKLGVVTGASIAAAWTRDSVRVDSGITTISEWELHEWSFCANPMQPLARVVLIGGREASQAVAPAEPRAWNDPRQPRMPDYYEAGGTGAHYVAALKEFERLKRAAPWAN